MTALRHGSVLPVVSQAETVNQQLAQAMVTLDSLIAASADPEDRCVLGTVRDLVVWAVALGGHGARVHAEIACAVLSRNLDAITISSAVTRDELRELDWLLRGAARLLARADCAASESASLTRH